MVPEDFESKLQKSQSKGKKQKIVRAYDSREISFDIVDGNSYYDKLLDAIRDSFTYQIVEGRRVTFPSPIISYDYRFLDIKLTVESYGITLRTVCDDAYLVAFMLQSNPGVWYCLRKELVDTLQGAVFVDLGENYSDLGKLNGASLGYGTVIAAIESLDLCKRIEDFKGLKTHIRNLIVNVIEPSRFTEIGEKVSLLMELFDVKPLALDLASLIQDWQTETEKLIKSLNIREVTGYPVIDVGRDWYEKYTVKQTDLEGGGFKYGHEDTAVGRAVAGFGLKLDQDDSVRMLVRTGVTKALIDKAKEDAEASTSGGEAGDSGGSCMDPGL